MAVAGLFSLLTLAGCSSHSSVWGATPGQPLPKTKHSVATIPEQEFNPITGDYETRPPFGSRENKDD
jgi:hypothetical protein